MKKFDGGFLAREVAAWMDGFTDPEASLMVREALDLLMPGRSTPEFGDHRPTS